MRLKKQYLLLLVVAGILLSGMYAYRAFAQNAVNVSVLTFTSTEGDYVFFDHTNGTIYVYNSRNGDLLSVWKVQRLGSPLVRLQ